jgi:hypothetical protein
LRAPALLLAAALVAYAAAKNRQTEYAVIAGTVFREPGYSVRGASVELAPGDEARKLKVKKMQTVTDSRGEFLFRVPALPASYTVKVKAAELAPQEKPVSVHGDERVDVTFLLAPASK